MKITIIIIIALVALLYFGGCNYRNIPSIKQHSKETIETNGFTLVGYEGYQVGNVLGRPGGRVWYIIERNGVNYDVCVSKWGEEYHLYCLKALDAITPTKP